MYLLLTFRGWRVQCHFGRREVVSIRAHYVNPDADREETEGMWTVFISLSPSQRLSLFTPSQKSSFPFPSLSLSYYLLPFHLPSPQSTSSSLFSCKEWEAFDLFFLSASTLRCLSASSHCQQFPTSFEPLNSSLLLFTILSTYFTHSKWARALPLSAVNASPPPLPVMRHLLHRGQGVH